MNYYLFNKLHLIFFACHLKKMEITSCGKTKMFSCTFSILASFHLWKHVVNVYDFFLETKLTLIHKDMMTHSQVPGWTYLRVQLCKVTESWDLEGAPDFQHYRGVEGRARSLGIRLGRGTSRSSLNMHPRTNHKRVSSHSGHPWVLGQATGTLTHKTHHGPDSGEATTFPHIVFSATLCGGYIQMALFPQTPKLESWDCPETVPAEVLGLWAFVTPDCRVWSQQGLNQSCNPHQDLSNAMLHSQVGKIPPVFAFVYLIIIGRSNKQAIQLANNMWN